MMRTQCLVKKLGSKIFHACIKDDGSDYHTACGKLMAGVVEFSVYQHSDLVNKLGLKVCKSCYSKMRKQQDKEVRGG